MNIFTQTCTRTIAAIFHLVITPSAHADTCVSCLAGGEQQYTYGVLTSHARALKESVVQPDICHGICQIHQLSIKNYKIAFTNCLSHSII